MLDKIYQPRDVEVSLYDKWESAGMFRAGEIGTSSFCCVLPPPNITGNLHMGHALNVTIQDVTCRFERMRGKDVLWQPGLDHAGIATQMVVERQLEQHQQAGRRTIGRAAFLERVWEWKQQSGGMIVSQLRRLGASCDWSRARFTMDEGMSRAVGKAFVSLYRDGLIYKDKRLVNWDPKLLTAISDIEVEQVEVQGSLWYFKYPIEGEPDRFLVIATTRPETIFGDTAVAVHPDDERYADMIGKTVILPLVGRRIPVIADVYSDPEKGTGAVKITPAHDFNDFEIGKSHGLDTISILDQFAQLFLKNNVHFLQDCDPPADTLALHGLDRVAARRHVVEMMARDNLLEKVEDYTHMVPFGDRSQAIIEPWITEQWYVDAASLAAPALELVKEGHPVFTPKSWEKTYFDWLNSIQPWCISRQLWWGHRIPAWYGPAFCSADGTLSYDAPKIFVAETEDEILSLAGDFYPVGREIIISRDEDINNHHPYGDGYLGDDVGGRIILYRDQDVLDTWFSSSLWPFSTLGWPDHTVELERFYPTKLLVTGFDIIFFWVARMMMMGLHLMKSAPFETVYIHALVRDECGRKMSKSKGNVIDPLQIIEDSGADVLRFTLVSMAAQGRDIKLSRERIDGYRNFITKLWNAARFAEMNGCVPRKNFDAQYCKTVLGSWIVGEMARTASAVTIGLETHRYNESSGLLYRFVWHTFCDWYLELAKPILNGDDEDMKEEVRAVTAWVLDQILLLSHPFIPFVTEELWSRIGEMADGRDSMLISSPWPEFSGLGNEQADGDIRWIIDLVTRIRSVRVGLNVPAGAMISIVLVAATEKIQRRVKSQGESLRRLARLSDVEFAKEAPESMVQFIIDGSVIALKLNETVDLVVERERLKREIGKLDAAMHKIDTQMVNHAFLSRAPEHVIEEQRKRLVDAKAMRCKLNEALEQIVNAIV